MKVKFCLLDLDHTMESSGPVMRIWGKTEDGKNVLILDRRFRPYLYVHPSGDAAKLSEKLAGLSVEGAKPLSVSAASRKIYGRETELLKVELRDPADVWKFRDAVKKWSDVREVLEFDITFYRRYLIDRGLIPMAWAEAEGAEEKTDFAVDMAIDASGVKPASGTEYPGLKMLALDIEMAEDNGEEKIIMVSLKGRAGQGKVITYRKVKAARTEIVGSEKEMLERLAQSINAADPDILVTYNGDLFDMLRIHERAVKLGVKMNIGRDNEGYVFVRRGRDYRAQAAGRVHVDIYNVVENMLSSTLSSEVLSLDAVSQELLGMGKDPVEYEYIEKAWKEGVGLDKVVRYCLKDSTLAMMLGENLLPQAFELCRVTGQTLFDASRSTYSQFVEWLLARRASEAGEIIPRRPPQTEIEARRNAEPYEGGYVYPPKEGIHENIALFDFRSLYPSIIITHNVSPETLDCQCCTGPDGRLNKVPGSEHHFCLKKKGFVAAVVDEVVRKRHEDRKKMETASTSERARLESEQKALKILANASYGYYSYPGSRWYSRMCAMAIAAWGREYIHDLIETAKAEGFEVIYGDTDSLFVTGKKVKDTKAFLKKVNSGLPEPMELEFKGSYVSGIFTLTKSGKAAKKRYALIDEQGKMTIRGFERVRRDWSAISKDTQEKVLLAVLKEKSPEKAVTIVKNIVDELRGGKVDLKELTIYTQMTKRISDYEQTGPHVEAAKKMVARGEPVGEGSIIAYVIAKGVGSISSRAEPAGDAKDYDPDYYIYNQVIPAAMRVLSALGYTEEDLTGKAEKDQASLDNFFAKKKTKHKK